MRFYEIPEDTFKSMTTESGVLLSDFDPTDPDFDNDDIITGTTGGIQINCNPTYSDLGEDVDNCPNNMMEFKKLEGWDISIVTTVLDTSTATLKLGLGAADVDSTNGTVTLRRDLKLSDFIQNVWWVCDKAGGGFVAANLKNALSTNGFSLQTGKNTKGKGQLTLTGHVSVKAQSTMPLKYYSIDSETVLTTETFSGDGETTAFTLAHSATTVTNVMVGGAAIPSTSWEYSQLSSTVTITPAPESGAQVKITYRYTPEV